MFKVLAQAHTTGKRRKRKQGEMKISTPCNPPTIPPSPQETCLFERVVRFEVTQISTYAICRAKLAVLNLIL